MLHVAFIVSGWSPEPEGQRHGCVLAMDGKYIVATGFNGPDRFWDKAAKLDGSPKKDCGGSCCKAPIVHAEVNALLNLKMVGAKPCRCVAYVSKKPGDPYMQALKNAGVSAIFWLQDVGDDRGQWVR